MVTAELKNDIIYILLNGDVSYDDFLKAVDPILKSGQKYIGFISDGRKMTTINPAVQHKLEQHHQTFNADKPNAILMNSDGKKVIADIYVKFTRAANTKVFTTEEEAINWVNLYRS